MIITIRQNAPAKELENLIKSIEDKGLQIHKIVGTEYSVLGIIGNTTLLDPRDIKALPFVENVQRVSAPYKLANRMFHQEDSIIDVAGLKIGEGQPFVYMAGPCAIENEALTLDIAENVCHYGAQILRGGAYKPRTSPYSFQGLGEEGIKYMVEARNKTGMQIVTELMDADQLDLFNEYVDLIQIGARNMSNFSLLKKLGKVQKPILLKRGMNATIEEWLMSAEYIMASGNENVILCERGIRTF